MMQKRYAFLALSAVLVVAGCGGAEQEETVVVQEDAAAAGMENPHATMEGATGGMPGGITTAEGVEDPHAAASSMPGRDGVTQIMFKCADDKAFLFALLEGVEKARITVDGESYELEQIPSASGMKFSDGTWKFFGKGPEALVMKNDEEVFTDCKAAGHP